MPDTNLTPEELGRDRIKEYDNKIIREGVLIYGDITWNYEFKRWQALANVCGSLCIIQVNVYKLEDQKGE